MKTTRYLGFGFVVVCMAASYLIATGQPPLRGPTTKEFMREKLETSQTLLEGLALENFDLIIAKAERLSAMSKEAAWQVFQNPGYGLFTDEFRRNADSIARAARKKNLDGATMAYVKLTMNCVECHKAIRGKLVAIVTGR